MAVNCAKLEKKIGITFKNKELLKEALTHRSYINERPNLKLKHNERLEFLGDAVLELVVTEYLFEKFPKKPEGELTNFRAALVKASTLAEVANEIKLDDYMLLSKGEAKDIGKARQCILADALEALIGAIYLDRGYKTSNSFIEKTILSPRVEILTSASLKDAKSWFQEQAQEIEGMTPLYKVLSEWGPDHNKHFVTGVYLGDKMIAEGEGSSKQEAQQKAAEAGLKKKKWG